MVQIVQNSKFVMSDGLVNPIEQWNEGGESTKGDLREPRYDELLAQEYPIDCLLELRLCSSKGAPSSVRLRNLQVNILAGVGS